LEAVGRFSEALKVLEEEHQRYDEQWMKASLKIDILQCYRKLGLKEKLNGLLLPDLNWYEKNDPDSRIGIMLLQNQISTQLWVGNYDYIEATLQRYMYKAESKWCQSHRFYWDVLALGFYCLTRSYQNAGNLLKSLGQNPCREMVQKSLSCMDVISLYYLRIKQYKQAQVWSLKCIKISPDFRSKSKYWGRLGLAYARDGQEVNAEQCFSQSLSEESPGYLLDKCEWLILKGDLEGAGKTVDRIDETSLGMESSVQLRLLRNIVKLQPVSEEQLKLWCVGYPDFVIKNIGGWYRWLSTQVGSSLKYLIRDGRDGIQKILFYKELQALKKDLSGFDLVWEKSSQKLYIHGLEVNVKPKSSFYRLLTAMIDKFPKFLEHTECCRILGCELKSTLLRVQLGRLRKSLPSSSWIKNVSGQGYCLNDSLRVLFIKKI
jgi:tetratricopeptide (TPR) repeat protein